ncbi:MAG: hypothetical protein ACE5LU_14010 [Anaerolineae bacterium]
MRYWSKGLGHRSALNIDWGRERVQITIENGGQLLASVVPSPLLRGKTPPEGEQVIIAGETLPPIVWRYISVLEKQDFEEILKLAMSRKTAGFLSNRPGGRRLFGKLAYLMAVFLWRYLRAWAAWKIRSSRHRMA